MLHSLEISFQGSAQDRIHSCARIIPGRPTYASGRRSRKGVEILTHNKLFKFRCQGLGIWRRVADEGIVENDSVVNRFVDYRNATRCQHFVRNQ